MSGWDERYDDEHHDDLPQPRRERVIDVSGEEPVIVETGSEFPFSSYAPERVRVFVAGGGRGTCAVSLITILLLLCCACVGFWVIVDNLF